MGKKGTLLLWIFLGIVFASPAWSLVEWEVQKELQLKSAPLGVVVAPKGGRTFVLTEDGKVLVFSFEGELKDEIRVGDHVDGIEAGPGEDILVLKSSKRKTVQYLSLDFVYDIPVAGSPFKGAGDAPVVIAVFNDFQ